MSSPTPHLTSRLSENLALCRARAKYVPDYVNGGLRLASVCEFSRPVFNPDDMEPCDDPLEKVVFNYDKEGPENDGGESSDDNKRRSIRRARLAVFDLSICNNFDLFSTLTFAADKVDRDDYNSTYHALKVWLSNKVQRKGLKYIAVPEYHKDGHAIHFHMLSNKEGIDLVDSGHWAHREKVYNIPSWQKGFSTAQIIKGEKAVDFTSKYICKYMTKSNGNKVGGRFYLSGGDLLRPHYVYADSIDELADTTSIPVYSREVSQDWGTFKEISYI